MANFAMICSFAFVIAEPVHAQRSARGTLQTARGASWYVRIATVSDTAEGRILTVFRDTVRLAEAVLYIPAVLQVDRRVGEEWRTIWTARPHPATPDTPLVAGISGFIYAGTAAALLPGPTFPIPPPVTAGLEFGIRNEKGEFTAGARTLLYPAPFVIATVDIGRNFRGSGRRYSGIAVGGMFATEGDFNLYPMFAVRAGVLPDARSGGRFEFRADAFVADGAAIIVSLHLGLQRSVQPASGNARSARPQ